MKAQRWTEAIVLMSLCIGFAACGGGDTEPQVADDTTTARSAGEVTAERPDTTGAAVWRHLQEANYADEWTFWPGKEPFYEGGEPHGMLLNTYLNDAASDAVTAGGAEFAHGSVLVKENYMPDSTLAAVTVMLKAANYDPEHGDWFWAKYGPDGTIEAEGRVESCHSCHGGEADGNFIMTGDL